MTQAPRRNAGPTHDGDRYVGAAGRQGPWRQPAHGLAEGAPDLGSHRPEQRACDGPLYKKPQVIECPFGRRKHYRRVAGAMRNISRECWLLRRLRHGCADISTEPDSNHPRRRQREQERSLQSVVESARRGSTGIPTSGSGSAAASTLSMRFPSRSTTSKRHPSQVTMSPVTGKRPRSHITIPDKV